jgi:hypothetical protein
MVEWKHELGWFELDVHVSVSTHPWDCAYFIRWLYLCFFNLLWVFIPIYALYESYQSLVSHTPATYAEITSKKQS